MKEYCSLIIKKLTSRRPLLGLLLIMAACLAAFFFQRPGGAPIRNFSDARHALEERVYYDHRETIYCGAMFTSDKRIIVPEGFLTPAQDGRTSRMEWEHAVPAENFGRSFKEWREGHPDCIRNGKPYRGRKCAEKTSAEYRRMETDLYNLFPAIGSVNAVRGNKPYSELGAGARNFGTCAAKTSSRGFEPPDRAKGRLARASLYMDAQYKNFQLSSRQKKLFEAWDKMFPVDKWECTRARRIEKIQANSNAFVKKPCQEAGLW